MIIRKATIEDAQQLQQLTAQLGYQLTINEMREHINTCISTGIYHYLVVEVDNVIAGLCVFVIYPKFYKKANNCLLEILVVCEQFRKQGIGSSLLNELESFAQSKHCSSISLISNLGRDKEIHDFYRRKDYHNEGLRAQLYLRKEL